MQQNFHICLILFGCICDGFAWKNYGDRRGDVSEWDVPGNPSDSEFPDFAGISGKKRKSAYHNDQRPGHKMDDIFEGQTHQDPFSDGGQKHQDPFAGEKINDLTIGQQHQDPFAEKVTNEFIRGQKHEDPFAGQEHEDPFAGQKHEDPFAGQEHEDPFAGQKHEDPFAGQEHEDPFAGQKHEDPFAGQEHENPFAGQKHEDPFAGEKMGDLIIGQKHEDPFAGQKHEDPFVGQKHEDPFAEEKTNDFIIGQKHEDPFAGEKTNDFIIGQKHEDPFAGEKMEDVVIGQKHEDPFAGQKHVDPFTGQKQEEPPAGEKMDDLIIGQKHEDPFAGQKQEDPFAGQKPEDVFSGQKHPVHPNGNEDIIHFPGDHNKNKLDDFEHIFFGRTKTVEPVTDTAMMQDDQRIIFPGDSNFDEKPIPKESSFRGGCNSRPPTPMNAILRCSLYSGCKATCQKGHEFPNGRVTMLMACKNGNWKIGGADDDWQVVPPCRPVCLPGCQNNGICIAPNQCQCQKNYGGPQCQFEKKPCLNYPSLPANSIRSCTTTSCTVTCAKGFEFPDGSTISNMVCKEGQWRVSRTDWVSLPDCRAICDPPCANGGVCLSLNVCQCPQQYTGPQCQYEMSSCTGEKLHFNGIHQCTGNGEQLVCQLQCPSGIEPSSPISQQYTCLYSTGRFHPQPIPQCNYGENVIVVPFNSSTHTYYTATQVEIGTSLSQGGAKGGKTSWDIVSLFEGDYLKPSPGSCYVWNGAHIKNFDGGLYSFDSPCAFTLSKDDRDSTFEIIIGYKDCKQSSCSMELTIHYQNSEYKFSAMDGLPQLVVDGKHILMPTQLVGFTAEITPSFTILQLHSLDISIKWDGINNFMSLNLNENLWNKTSGLCGRLNKNSADDFLQKNGEAARSLEAFLDSWSVPSSDLSTCDTAPKVASPCAASDRSPTCDLLLHDRTFAQCRNVVNVKPFYDACMWDSCQCGSNCSCSSISAFVQQCQHHLKDPCPSWRIVTGCAFQCPSTQVYSSCAATRQETCGDIEQTGGSSLAECVEGCVCPGNMVLNGSQCIERDLCPCQLRGKSFPSGSSIPKGCNTCSCGAGRWTCTEVQCGARCSAIGDPHYVTFDGRRYDFMGQCSYYLLHSHNYSIQAENVPCSGAISRGMLLAPGPDVPTCTRTVTVRFKGIVLRLKQNSQVYVNNEEIPILPYQDAHFSIRSVSSIFLIVSLENGIDIWWDGITSVYVDVPAHLQGQTKGLCGTFNQNQKDDFITPEGDVEQAVVPFANKWKTEETCKEMVDKISEHPCDRDPSRKEKAIRLCSKLTSSVFRACHWHVDVEPAYQNCLYDVCSCAFDERSCLCPVLADYASECAREGLPLIWRTHVKECGIHCPSGQTYQACGDTCSRSCQDLSLFPDCRRRCVEGCNCPEGQTLDNNGNCIPIPQCPCLHHGREYAAATNLVMDNYKGPQFCTCANAVWDCRPATPSEAKEHSEMEEIKSRCLAVNHEEFTICEPAEPITCKNMHNPPQHSPAKCIPGCTCKKGFVWDSIGKRCLKGSECPCHHGGVSYENGSSIQEDCNKCNCVAGQWKCSERQCPAVCSTWGDSHFKTFDGKIFDFQGSCDFLFAGGALSDLDVFDVKLQIVPCGTSGISCPKSVTIKVGKNDNSEEVVLTKGRTIPHINAFNRTIVREAGLFVFVEVFDLGLVLQWDRGTRIYLKADPRWRSKVKGLCGNMNNDEADDFSSPSGNMNEISPVLFADSWRLLPYCPDSSPIQNPCISSPHRRDWALLKCGILKTPVFHPCHSEVPLDPYLERCVLDTCGCDEGGDCECLCAAVAAYAHECALHGVPIKWRSQQICPLQCDEPQKYSSCMSSCPIKTCDNLLVHNSLTQFCGQESCVEGCEKPICPDNKVFSNSSMEECIEPSKCSSICLVVNGATFFEGDFMEGDNCHSCYCSHHKKVCSGVPCTTEASTTTQVLTTEALNDATPQCVGGWTSWINTDHPIQLKKYTDYEPLPSSNILALAGSPAHCNHSQIANIRCRDSNDLTNYKETGFDVECSLERGLVCDSTTTPCPDFEISVLCDCFGVVTTPSTPATTTKSTTTVTTTAAPCPIGQKWVECAVFCNRTCHFFGHYLMARGLCSSQHACVPGCRDQSWEPCDGDDWLRDAETCVNRKHCTCRSDGGDLVKPGVIHNESECGKCQCINSQYECDFSNCFGRVTRAPSTTPMAREDSNILNVTPPNIMVGHEKHVSLIYLPIPSTITPPPLCADHKYHSLLKGNGAARTKSNSHPKEDVNIGLDSSLHSWTAEKDNLEQFLEVDLGENEPVYGVSVSGDKAGNYITSFRLSYSSDGVAYRFINTPDSINEVFRGPIDTHVPIRQILSTPVEARYVRFHPFTWHGAISMRVDVLGCGEEAETSTTAYIVTNTPPICDDPMGVDGASSPIMISVSSAKPGHGRESVGLSSPSAWKPLVSSHLEFIKIDLLEPRNVTGIETKGTPHGNEIDVFTPEAWVESYKIYYSADEHKWNPMMDRFGKEKVFLGNFNGETSKWNWFDLPIKARYIKLVPVTWRHEIALRIELFGCYEPYTARPTMAPPPTTVTTCPICPGVEAPQSCPCIEDTLWDGESCSPRTECPCILGHMSYAVGTIFSNEKCEECTCRINGIQSCAPKTCPSCPQGLRNQLTPSCGCICKPCPTGTLLCPTTEICIPETAWCDGVQDCPDDETNCTVPLTQEPELKCNATCPPGYSVVYTSESQYVEILETSQYKAVKKGYSKGGQKGIKSTKGKKNPTPVKIRQRICPPFECVAIPTLPPTQCPEPSCPPDFTVTLPEIIEASSCPRYSCQPPIEHAVCTLSGRTFNTFDGSEYKYDVCDHVFATDIHDGAWNVTVFKTCHSFAPCSIGVIVNHEGTQIILKDSTTVKFNDFDYTVDQVGIINSKTNKFNISYLGETWLFTSNKHKFTVFFHVGENVRLEVEGILKGRVNGLCGLYNGISKDDKTRPDGLVSHSTNDFGKSWMTPGAPQCDTKICPVDIQNQALAMCTHVEEEPFTTCSKIVNTNHFLSRCLETSCACLQSNRTAEECRCAALLDYVSSCKSLDMTLQFPAWRLTHDCPAECPPDKVFYDCYPFTCEPTCEELSCVTPSTSCFPGCYCSEGLIRKGDACVKPSMCQDCVCDGLGHSNYMSFDQNNFTFGGNCSYVAARDVPPSGIPNFQVIVTNVPCSHGGDSQCTDQITIFVRNHKILLASDEDKQAFVSIDGENINNFPQNLSWILIEQVTRKSVSVLLPSLSLQVAFSYPTFSVSLPSHLYKNRTEGLCGNCNKDPTDEDLSSAQLSEAWLVQSHAHQERCLAPKPQCQHHVNEGETALCRSVENKQIFGKCHALIDPAPYLSLCLEHLCHNGSVCGSVEAYAKACSDAGVCVDWRSPRFCPYDCPIGLVHNACGFGCGRTCDNYKELQARPESCSFKNLEGCFCPNNKILINGTCVEESWCETCDEQGHRAGDTWAVDNCTSCTCDGRIVNCTREECSAVETVCSHGFSPLIDTHAPGVCCPKYICVPNPTAPTVTCPENIMKPECGFGQLIELETDSVGCPAFKCRCKDPDECDELPVMDENELPQGMYHILNTSGCCPRSEIICDTAKCPEKPTCQQYYHLELTPPTDCCPSYKCQKPLDLCLYDKGGNRKSGLKSAKTISNLIAQKVGDSWQDGLCKTCKCVNGSSEAEIICTVRECPSIEKHTDAIDYELQAIEGKDACCPDIIRNACRHNGTTHRVNEMWFPKEDDKCVTAHCVRNEHGEIVKETRTEKCKTDCELGWRYESSKNGCCGRCVQIGCVIDDKIYKAGENWPSPDNCTTFSCLDVLGGYLVTSEYEKCPDLSDCPVEDRYQAGCCSKCRPAVTALSNCAPNVVPGPKTIGLVLEYQTYHGKCVNMAPIDNFSECSGACDSHTTYNKETWSHDSICECCQATFYKKLQIPLTCEDGYIIEKTISVPLRCKCQACGGS